MSIIRGKFMGAARDTRPFILYGHHWRILPQFPQLAARNELEIDREKGQDCHGVLNDVTPRETAVFVYDNFKIVGENVPETPETLCVLTANKSVQALITPKFRSKAVQTTITSTEKALTPLKPSKISTSTSPFKSETIINSSPSMSGLSKITRNMSDEAAQSDSDNSLYVPSTSTTSCSPVHSLQVKSSSDCSEFIEEDKRWKAKETMLNVIKKIEKSLDYTLVFQASVTI
ncbi:hypothetical protein EVAR_90377_1 [Eumeta japonica]|uniref:Uncharacterized protein n=1 Tax=Eumeta variegata TaxID=151549 RepID=A0A4C1YB71_EUMVA|nr:hypothetical protein EVAR_90377_1 [Eumeta japonica]